MNLGATGMEQAWSERVHDTRHRVRTGWAALDDDLHRGGLAPGELAILGGRTHTRKTTVLLNIIGNLVKSGTRVGFVALDETVAGYTAKLHSVLTGLTMEQLEVDWEGTADRRAEATAALTGKLSLARQARPSFEYLTAWFEDAAKYDLDGKHPEVVFIDYLSLLTRDKFAGQEVQRVQRLIEELQVWTSANEVVTVALHQVGRMDELSSRRYHGDKPMTLESLKFGGEEVADVVLGTYRPELDPIGNMAMAEATAQGISEEEWEEASARVGQHKGVTFLQLLKNRPGVHLNHKGVRLLSPTESMHMVPAEQGADDGKVVQLHG